MKRSKLATQTEPDMGDGGRERKIRLLIFMNKLNLYTYKFYTELIVIFQLIFPN